MVLWLGCGAGLVWDGFRVDFRFLDWLVQLGICGFRGSSAQVWINSGLIWGWLRVRLLGFGSAALRVV